MDNNEALNILKSYRNKVWPEVKSYLKGPSYPYGFKVPKKYLSIDKFHWDIVSEYPKRKGKYFRPTLLLLTCEAMGESSKKAIKTAAAMQLSEEWLLVHDDIEDSSLERRGKPTLHRQYGVDYAINAGDALHFVMWKAIFDNHNLLGYKKTREIADEFYKTLARTALGQTAEILWRNKDVKHNNPSDWYFIADGKTSYYTVACPMRLGAIIAGTNNVQLHKLAQFGIYLGRCFQLVDDILDVTSDFSGQKKQMGNDIYEKKRTVMLNHLIKNANQRDKNTLIKILNKAPSAKTKSDIAWVIAKMHKYDSINYAQKLAKDMKQKAYKSFKEDLGFLKRKAPRDKLETLIHFVLERKV
ncbi:polyprenyl synthetase family protein [Patescibacteria group bacterium]